MPKCPKPNAESQHPGCARSADEKELPWTALQRMNMAHGISAYSLSSCERERLHTLHTLPISSQKSNDVKCVFCPHAVETIESQDRSAVQVF